MSETHGMETCPQQEGQTPVAQPAQQPTPPQPTLQQQPTPPANAGYYYIQAQPQVALKPKQPFAATCVDAVFAILCYALGYLFVKLMIASIIWEGIGITAFTAIYATALLWYARASKLLIPKNSWYWLAILLTLAVSFTLLPGGSLRGWRGLFLFGAAVYWAGSLFGGLLQDKTGNLVALDALNLLFAVPFRNFGCGILSLTGFKSKAQTLPKNTKFCKRQVGGIFLGIVIVTPLLLIVVPMLMMADQGNFTSIVNGFKLNLLRAVFYLMDSNWLNPILFVLAVPVALYLCGLVAGLCHKRYSRNFDEKNVEKNLSLARMLPLSTVITILGAVGVVYLVFMGSQAPYFFSAFAGQRAAGYEVYSQYAREGFFELCRIAAINLGILLALNVLSRNPRKENLPLRVGNLLLMALTLLLVATAFSKMGLYISAYGLTPKRVLTCVAMAFIALVCIGVMVLQFKAFSIARFALVAGSVLACLLCLVNLDGIIINYNAERYIAGTLDDFDTSMLWDAGGAGWNAAVRVYEHTEDEALQREILNVLKIIQSYGEITPNYQWNVVAGYAQNQELPK